MQCLWDQCQFLQTGSECPGFSEQLQSLRMGSAGRALVQTQVEGAPPVERAAYRVLGSAEVTAHTKQEGWLDT